MRGITALLDIRDRCLAERERSDWVTAAQQRGSHVPGTPVDLRAELACWQPARPSGSAHLQWN